MTRREQFDVVVAELDLPDDAVIWLNLRSELESYALGMLERKLQKARGYDPSDVERVARRGDARAHNEKAATLPGLTGKGAA